MLGNNLGKLRIMPHSSPRLERWVDQSSGGTGWACGVSGRRGCNVPSSLQRVRVVGAIARRWILRHESRPYGVQQARKLHTAGNCDEGIPSGMTMLCLLPTFNRLVNKGWERPVPAAAVIPAPQVVVAFIGPKTSVACLVHSWVNQAAQRLEFCEDGQTRDRERCGELSG